MNTRISLALAFVLGLAVACGMGAGPPDGGEQTDGSTGGVKCDCPMPPKVPHLVVAATGEDLGALLSGNCVWHAVAGGEVCYGSSPSLSFVEKDCGGQPYVGASRKTQRYFGTVGGDIYRGDGEVQRLTILSRKTDGACSNINGLSSDVRLGVAVGVQLQRHEPTDLAIELR